MPLAKLSLALVSLSSQALQQFLATQGRGQITLYAYVEIGLPEEEMTFMNNALQHFLRVRQRFQISSTTTRSRTAAPLAWASAA